MNANSTFKFTVDGGTFHMTRTDGVVIGFGGDTVDGKHIDDVVDYMVSMFKMNDDDTESFKPLNAKATQTIRDRLKDAFINPEPAQ